MRSVTRSSSSKVAVGVSTEGLQRCKRGDECQNHPPHTEMNFSEFHLAHGDSDVARSAKREEENRR